MFLLTLVKLCSVSASKPVIFYIYSIYYGVVSIKTNTINIYFLLYLFNVVD